MRKMKLFPKTFLYTMILMSIVVIVTHLLLYILLPSVYVDQKNKNLTSLQEEAIDEMKGKELNEVLEIAKRLSEHNDTSITVTTKEKTYIFSSFVVLNSVYSDDSGAASDSAPKESINNEAAIGSASEPSISDQITTASLFSIEDNSTLQERIQPITRNADITILDGSSVSLQFTMNLQSVSDASEVMFNILPYTITISIILSLCAAYFYAKALTRPIKEICKSTKEMEKLNEHAICEVATHDEIGELAQDINQLYASLQSTIQSLETEIAHVSKAERMKVDFLRSASHELKTPLTSMSVILENMMLNVGKYKDHETYLCKCKMIVDQLSKMIRDILDASSLDGADPDVKETIKLDDWLKKVSDSYLLLAKARKIRVSMDISQPLCLSVNAPLLEKAISNILSNAVQYTDSGHQIAIVLKNRKLSIYNECQPIDEEQLPHLSEAFYRPDFSRSKQTGGNGLGLYFVDQILHLLRYPYTFAPYEKGMCFTIDLTEA